MRIRPITILFFLAALLAAGVFADGDSSLPGPDSIGKWKTVFSDKSVPKNALPGDVISIYPGKKSEPVRSSEPVDPYVFGVATLDSTGELRIARGGEVEVNIDPSAGPVSAGTWLVSSGGSGRAMPIPAKWPVTPVVIGITMENWHPDSSATTTVLLTPGEKVTPDGSANDE